jgi:hypothetical protein
VGAPRHLSLNAHVQFTGMISDAGCSSDSGNAFNVSVEMFPSETADSVNLAHASSLGNLEI